MTGQVLEVIHYAVTEKVFMFSVSEHLGIIAIINIDATKTPGSIVMLANVLGKWIYLHTLLF